MCLTSLYNQSFKEWDLVLVDDASDIPILNHPFLREIVLRIKGDGNHGVSILRTDVSNGVCSARNLAVEKDEWNDVFVRIDDDSIIASDYLERLYKLYKYPTLPDTNIPLQKVGAISGIVPQAGSVEIYKNLTKLKVINRIEHDNLGNLTFLGDDCGYSWLPEKIMPAHHLRSSFLFTRQLWKDVGGFSVPGQVGFREETSFCLKGLWKGYCYLVDTGAKCFHARAMSGGTRSYDYNLQVQAGDKLFRNWFKRKYLNEGSPFINEVYK